MSNSAIIFTETQELIDSKTGWQHDLAICLVDSEWERTSRVMSNTLDFDRRDALVENFNEVVVVQINENQRRYNIAMAKK